MRCHCGKRWWMILGERFPEVFLERPCVSIVYVKRYRPQIQVLSICLKVRQWQWAPKERHLLSLLLFMIHLYEKLTLECFSEKNWESNSRSHLFERVFQPKHSICPIHRRKLLISRDKFTCYVLRGKFFTPTLISLNKIFNHLINSDI